MANDPKSKYPPRAEPAPFNDDLKVASTEPLATEPIPQAPVKTEEEYRGVVIQLRQQLMTAMATYRSQDSIPRSVLANALNILGVPDDEHPQ